jgi:AcrR family transcriptional regulator
MMGDRPPGGRRDALRNRKLLTDKAREVFTEQGLNAPLDEIARRAGVGNATPRPQRRESGHEPPKTHGWD